MGVRQVSFKSGGRQRPERGRARREGKVSRRREEGAANPSKQEEVEGQVKSKEKSGGDRTGGRQDQKNKIKKRLPPPQRDLRQAVPSKPPAALRPPQPLRCGAIRSFLPAWGKRRDAGKGHSPPWLSQEPSPAGVGSSWARRGRGRPAGKGPTPGCPW